jgi:hypothetical protein
MLEENKKLLENKSKTKSNNMKNTFMFTSKT